MTVSSQSRRKLEEAIGGLIDGTITPADGKLTWKNVAVVAEVSKATADRAVDLRDDFRRRLEQRNPPQSRSPAPKSRSRSDVDAELTRLRQQSAELKESTKALHSVILALVQENHRLARHHRPDNTGFVALNTIGNAATDER